MSIIALAGYAGSGKDTVAKVIQYLTSPCSDPNGDRYRTFEQFMFMGGGSEPRNFDHHYYTEWEVKKFAGKLKEIASILTGIPVHMFEDQEFKKTSLSFDWTVWKTNNGTPPKEGDAGIGKLMTVREFLQKLGTDALRDNLHTNVWVNALFADYIAEPDPAVAEFLKAEGLPASMNGGKLVYPNWIITDCRFPNEAQAVKARDGIIIRVLRPGNEPVNLHSSETALDDYSFDDVILNDGTVEDLIPKVQHLLKEQSILV